MSTCIEGKKEKESGLSEEEEEEEEEQKKKERLGAMHMDKKEEGWSPARTLAL